MEAKATQALIRAYFQPVLVSKPLALGAIERALLLANDVPGLAVTGVLQPSANVQGASDLIVTIVETPYQGGLSADNRGTQFTGVWTLGGYVEANGLIRAGSMNSAAPMSPNASPHGSARNKPGNGWPKAARSSTRMNWEP